ncbi:MAG: hypothetical protein BGO49_21430 [Planctomycetales bacterium 71-10]|nr:MAG: hypothetical protein BGO49_21430 [Planctomycetales bacterium 71-10]
MAPLPPLEDLIPLAEVARRMRMSRDAVHDWRMRFDNPLACWKLGHRWYTTEAAIEAFVRAGTDPEPVGVTVSPSPAPAPPTVPFPAPRRGRRKTDHDRARELLGLDRG